MLASHPGWFLSLAKTLMLRSQASGHDGAHGENADASQASGHDGALGENADDSVPNSEAANKRIEEIMNFVSEVSKPDDSKMCMRDDQHFVLPPWAIDRNTAKCAFCEKVHKAGRPEGGEGKLACSSCGGILLIAEEVATATSDMPWTTEDLDLAKEVMKANRDIHDLQTQASVKAETKEPKGKRQESFIHQCFGHDQGVIEGFKDCEEKLKQALDREMVERKAATEFEGAVKTEKVVDAQKGDDKDGNRLEEKISPDSQKADNEDEDHFGRSEFSEMGC